MSAEIHVMDGMNILRNTLIVLESKRQSITSRWPLESIGTVLYLSFVGFILVDIEGHLLSMYLSHESIEHLEGDGSGLMTQCWYQHRLL